MRPQLPTQALATSLWLGRENLSSWARRPPVTFLSYAYIWFCFSENKLHELIKLSSAIKCKSRAPYSEALKHTYQPQHKSAFQPHRRPAQFKGKGDASPESLEARSDVLFKWAYTAAW